MPKRYNADRVHAIIQTDEGHVSVAPGEPYDFSDEQLEAGIVGSWSVDPVQPPEPEPDRPPVWGPADTEAETATTAPAGDPEQTQTRRGRHAAADSAADSAGEHKDESESSAPTETKED